MAALSFTAQSHVAGIAVVQGFMAGLIGFHTCKEERRYVYYTAMSGAFMCGAVQAGPLGLEEHTLAPVYPFASQPFHQGHD